MSNILSDTTRNIYLANCLYDCIEDSNIRAVKKLLHENGANANIIIPDKGMAPFHFAIGSGSESSAEEITKLFVIYGGNPNVRSMENITPVHIAAAWGRFNVLKILLQFGGDPTLKDEEDKTPLDYAKTENYSAIVDYLESFIENLNQATDLDKLQYAHDLSTNSYVRNWCMKHANMTPDINGLIINDNNINTKLNVTHKTINKNLNISINSKEDNNLDKENCLTSSEESVIHKNYSRESGILTLPGNSVENIVDKCVINEFSENTEYMTCDSVETFERNITNSLLTSDLSNPQINHEILNITSDKSNEKLTKTDEPSELKVEEKENSLVSVQEECKYIDNEVGIVLIEKRILVNPKIDDNKSIISGSSKISMDYDTDTLRHELTCRGEPPGPITTTTKRIYLRKLKKLQKHILYKPPITETDNSRVYSVELEKTLRNPEWTSDLTSYRALESVIVNQFSKPEPTKRWREGVTKASFTYLLLDPRITLNLPVNSSELSQDEIWKTFLSAIFYVGKGKRSRPYSHLYEAVNFWKKGDSFHRENKKITYILDIWQHNFGVVCLHIFQNVIPVEAYTREAAMINALKLQNLCNSKLGDFYGICATWPERKKRLLGVYLLYRAMLIFLNEGERQLMPDDIGK